MDFFKRKQPIALPLDSEGEKLLEDNKGLNPDPMVNAPQQQESTKRCCCFKKGSRGRKILRRLGHFLILSAFFYWLWGPQVGFRREAHELHDIQLSDFTDVDVEVPGAIPNEFLLVQPPTFPHNLQS